jgi:hypothetical protein
LSISSIQIALFLFKDALVTDVRGGILGDVWEGAVVKLLIIGVSGTTTTGAFENPSFMLLASYAGKVEVLVVKNDEVGP